MNRTWNSEDSDDYMFKKATQNISYTEMLLCFTQAIVNQEPKRNSEKKCKPHLQNYNFLWDRRDRISIGIRVPSLQNCSSGPMTITSEPGCQPVHATGLYWVTLESSVRIRTCWTRHWNNAVVGCGYEHAIFRTGWSGHTNQSRHLFHANSEGFLYRPQVSNPILPIHTIL